MLKEQNRYDDAEYVSPTRWKIRKLLEDWHQEIRDVQKAEMSQQKAKDIEREREELGKILNILANVYINPQLDPNFKRPDSIVFI